MKSKIALALFATLMVGFVSAHEQSGRADSHAPIGVMGDHLHKQGELMVSLRHMSMSMSGNLQDGENISSDEIATTVPNRFAGMPGMPPTLRIVPQDMEMSMSMLGLMYAPTDWLTLMLMSHYVDKSMTLRSYQGAMGDTVRGHFQTRAAGLGDTHIAGLVSLYQGTQHKVHLTMGLSLPTGDIDKSGGVLVPMGPVVEAGESADKVLMRLPYAMQLGSGTLDIEPGLTYTGMSTSFSWGAQYRAELRSGENDEAYSLGDLHALSTWGQYLFHPSVSGSLRATAKTVGQIDGMDTAIMGPVQTADPSNYGGDFVDVALGWNFLGLSGFLKGQRLAVEYSLPVLQNAHGLQMKKEAMWTLGYQYAFQ